MGIEFKNSPKSNSCRQAEVPDSAARTIPASLGTSPTSAWNHQNFAREFAAGKIDGDGPREEQQMKRALGGRGQRKQAPPLLL